LVLKPRTPPSPPPPPTQFVSLYIVYKFDNHEEVVYERILYSFLSLLTKIFSTIGDFFQ
jgi:hypothetical protein